MFYNGFCNLIESILLEVYSWKKSETFYTVKLFTKKNNTILYVLLNVKLVKIPL